MGIVIQNGKIQDSIVENYRVSKTSDSSLEGLISAEDSGNFKVELAAEHAAEPIKSIKDIEAITLYLIGQGRWRDNMLFIVGINFGLRVSDLRMLRFGDLINPDLTFKDEVVVFEKKTRNTRRKKKNRHITINDAVKDAVTLYLENTITPVSLGDYMFTSHSNNSRGSNRPLDSNSIDRILKGIARDLNLTMKVSTHTLRKTFCYHQMAMSDNSTRKLVQLQKMLGHSSMLQTLDYIGITDEEISEEYKNLNLGSFTSCYVKNTEVVDEQETTQAG